MDQNYTYFLSDQQICILLCCRILVISLCAPSDEKAWKSLDLTKARLPWKLPSSSAFPFLLPTSHAIISWKHSLHKPGAQKICCRLCVQGPRSKTRGLISLCLVTFTGIISTNREAPSTLSSPKQVFRKGCWSDVAAFAVDAIYSYSILIPPMCGWRVELLNYFFKLNIKG